MEKEAIDEDEWLCKSIIKTLALWLPGHPGGDPQRRSRQLVLNRRTFVDDDIDAGDEEGIGIMAGQRFWLRRRLRVKLGNVVSILFVAMVMPAGAVPMMAVIVVARGRRRVRVKMRLTVVFGGLAAAVRVAECG